MTKTAITRYFVVFRQLRHECGRWSSKDRSRFLPGAHCIEKGCRLGAKLAHLPPSQSRHEHTHPTRHLHNQAEYTPLLGLVR